MPISKTFVCCILWRKVYIVFQSELKPWSPANTPLLWCLGIVSIKRCHLTNIGILIIKKRCIEIVLPLWWESLCLEKWILYWNKAQVICASGNGLAINFLPNQGLKQQQCWYLWTVAMQWLWLALICAGPKLSWVNYRQVSNISRTKSQHLQYSPTVLRLSLPNPLKPDVKSRMKM